MFRTALIACAAVAATAFAPMAQADGVYWSLNVAVPGAVAAVPYGYTYSQAPVYVMPSPTYGYGPVYQAGPPPVRYERRDGWRGEEEHHHDHWQGDDEQ
ncbi:MAG: hypothetical protein KGO02_01015 [Alphaproteobacteria bacterium]|nr:hypothetical protein [Alphaproteobacteria bacterium]